MWEQGFLRLPTQSELVPLGTQIASAAIAEAFQLPFQPSEAGPGDDGSHRQQQGHGHIQEHRAQYSFPPYSALPSASYGRIPNRPQPNELIEPAASLRTYTNGYPRPGFADRSAVRYQHNLHQQSQPGVTSRDSGSYAKPAHGICLHTLCQLTLSSQSALEALVNQSSNIFSNVVAFDIDQFWSLEAELLETQAAGVHDRHTVYPLCVLGASVSSSQRLIVHIILTCRAAQLITIIAGSGLPVANGHDHVCRKLWSPSGWPCRLVRGSRRGWK